MPDLTITTTIDISAGRDKVWGVLVDFDKYAQWNPSVRISGRPVVGSKLAVRMGAGGAYGMSFRPKVLVATPDRELRWLGRLGLGGLADGEHFFVLSTNNDGTTRLTHGEHYSGLLVALARGHSEETRSYDEFNRALKQRVEGGFGDPHGNVNPLEQTS